MKKPLLANSISVVVPVFNSANLLSETLNSVLAQTLPTWECIIVDDGSTDESLNLAKSFQQKDNRFRVYTRNKDYLPGGNGARNMGLDLAKSAWVVFLDADDLIHKDCLKNRLAVVQNQLCDLAAFGTLNFKDGKATNRWNAIPEKGYTNTDLLNMFIKINMPWHTIGVVWSKEYLKSIGKWDENLKAWQDWELAIRAIVKEGQILIQNTVADSYYRRDVNSSISSSNGYSLGYLKHVINSMNKVCSITHFNKSSRAYLQETLNKYIIKKAVLSANVKPTINYIYKSGYLLNVLGRTKIHSNFILFSLLKSARLKSMAKQILGHTLTQNGWT